MCSRRRPQSSTTPALSGPRSAGQAVCTVHAACTLHAASAVPAVASYNAVVPSLLNPAWAVRTAESVVSQGSV